MTGEPRIPFTHRELQVVERMGRGWSYKRIASDLGLHIGTVGRYANDAAEKLDNPDSLTPQLLVVLWAAHRRWVQGESQKRPAA